MTNPNNAVGTNGAFGGRTSVNAFNDVMGALSRGILSGWACVPNSGLTVSLGGNGTVRDCAVAEDNAGNKTSINNISNSPINVTIGAAPGTNSRIDAIVAYVDNPPTVSVEVTDNPAVCGLIVVQGTAASTPVAPNDSKIRTAITSDGASGTTAYYVVLAYITMASGTTDITSGEIAAGPVSQIGNNMVDNSAINNGSVTPDKLKLQTSTCNLTFMSGSTQTGTGTATLIPLDSTGLTMLAFDGSTGFNDAGTGERQMTINISNGLSSVLGGAINARYAGDVNAYMTFSALGASSCDFWMSKSTAVSELLSVSLIMIGYVS